MKHRRVAVLLSGGGSNMEALVRSMRGDHPARPALVVSNDPAAAGLDRARALGVEAVAVDHRAHPTREGFEAHLDGHLRAAGAEVVALAGFMRVLTAGFVEGWAGRILNVHPSLLPKYRGLHTHARALAAGDAEVGCTIHEVVPELDAGPILGQARVPVQPGDTADDLATQVLRREHVLYPLVLRRYVEGDRTPVLL